MNTHDTLYARLQAFAHQQLGPYQPGDRRLSGANCLIVVVIFVSLVLFTLESDPEFQFHDTHLLRLFTLTILLIFVAEFLARLFAAGHEEHYRGLRGRLRFYRDNWFLALVDLLAFAPEIFYVMAGLPSPAWLRTLRIVRLIKLARYMSGIALIFEAVHQSRRELGTAISVAVVLWYVGAVALYLAERTAQPEHFGSIPEAMWWSVVTMTTVGYGEVVPTTSAGKILSGFFMLLAMGVVALPSGILAGSFMHRYRERHAHEEESVERETPE